MLRRCMGCGQQFETSTVSRRRHCAAGCRVRAHRARRAGGGLAAQYDYWRKKADDPDTSPGLRDRARRAIKVLTQGSV